MYISTDNTFATFITTPEFAWNNTEDWQRGQSSTPTAGGYLSVVDRGYHNRIITGLIPEVTHSVMMDLKEFFIETLQCAMSTFYTSTINIRKSSTWNRRETPFLYGTYLSGYIKYGATYDSVSIKYGQLIGSDFEVIGPLRLQSNGFKVIEKGRGIYDISLAAVIENAG